MEKQAKKLLKYISDKKNNPDGYIISVIFYDTYEQLTGVSRQEIKAILRYLNKQGYIKFSTSRKGAITGFELEHKGHHPKAFKFIEFRKYLLNHWIAIVALIISIVSITMQL